MPSTAARAGAEKASGGEWRQWSFLSLQVQLAAERHLAARTRQADASTELESVDEGPAYADDQPSTAELAAELEELRSLVKRLNAERDRRSRGNPYAETGDLDRQIGVMESRVAATWRRSVGEGEDAGKLRSSMLA